MLSSRPSERSENPTSGRLRSSASTTVATALASADTDCDNGAAFRGMPRHGRCDGNALHQVAHEVPRGNERAGGRWRLARPFCELPLHAVLGGSQARSRYMVVVSVIRG
jgi:hypothetical protein